MPNGGHASPWSCPHTSDDEEIWAEKMRFRVLGARVVKRWKLLVARNKRARASEERRRRHIRRREFLRRHPPHPPPPTPPPSSSTESESPIRGRQHGSRSRSPHSSRSVNGRSIGPIVDFPQFVNGMSIGPIFDLGWNIGLIDYDIEESQGFGD